MIKINGKSVLRIPINGKETLRVMKNGEQLWSGTGLPAGYTLLEYIESTGTQYIDTGFIPNQDTKVVMDADISGTSDGWGGIISSRAGTNARKNAFTVYCYNNQSTIETQFGTQAASGIAVSLSGRHLIDKDKIYVKVDGNTVHTFSSESFTGSYDVRLFADKSDQAIHHFVVGKIYSCQIYDNGTLVRDFIPCINPSGTYGLYDKVNKQFYTSESSTDFIGA